MGFYLVLFVKLSGIDRNKLWGDEIFMADMPSCLEGEDNRINAA